MKGGRAAGDEHVARLAGWLDGLRATGQPLPARGGRPNLTAIAKACGLNREVLYQNQRCTELIRRVAAELDLAAVESRSVPDADRERTRLERRIAKLEQQNAALYAKVHELRRRLQQAEGIEAVMAANGRRIIP